MPQVHAFHDDESRELLHPEEETSGGKWALKMDQPHSQASHTYCIHKILPEFPDKQFSCHVKGNVE